MAKKAKKQYVLDLEDRWEDDDPIWVDRLVKMLNEEWRVRVCDLKTKHKQSSLSVVPAFSYRNNGYGEFVIYFFGWDLTPTDSDADNNIQVRDGESKELAAERIRENVRALLKTFSKLDW